MSYPAPSRPRQTLRICPVQSSFYHQPTFNSKVEEGDSPLFPREITMKKTSESSRRRPRRISPTRSGAVTAAVLETLEQRRLLATSSISNGVVTVDGDTDSDVLLIQTSS